MTDSDQGAERRPSFARSYPHVLRAVFETPWAIREETYHVITEVVRLRVEGVRLSDDEIADRIGAGPSSRPTTQQGAIQIIPLYGVLMPKATLMSQISGGTSVEQFAAQVKAAANDPQVGSILLDVNSPGGSSALMPETAAVIRAASRRKPVVAVANTQANSGAYWLASQAGELVVTPSGFIGSVGVYYAHDDMSAMQEKLGVKTTYISAGKYKVDGNDTEPLTESAREHMQAVVEEVYDMFVADVAKGRRVPVGDVRGPSFGEGRVVSAKAAVAQGMADRVDTFDGTVARMAAGQLPARGARTEDAIEVAQPAADQIAAEAAEELAVLDGEKQRTAVDHLFAKYIEANEGS